MPTIPLIVVWFAVLSGYLPYNMGFAFLNPMLIIAYGFLSLLIAANVPNVKHAIAASATTTLLALLTVNATSGIPHLVLPALTIILSSHLLSATGTLATAGIRSLLLARGKHEDQIRTYLRINFAVFAVLLYNNSYLPYETKMWLAERTTNEDLIRFALFTSILFLAIWRTTSRSIRIEVESLGTQQ
jgi:hypothetical protein